MFQKLYNSGTGQVGTALRLKRIEGGFDASRKTFGENIPHTAKKIWAAFDVLKILLKTIAKRGITIFVSNFFVSQCLKIT